MKEKVLNFVFGSYYERQIYADEKNYPLSRR